MQNIRMMMRDAQQQDEDIQREIGQRQVELQRLAELLLINRGRLEVLQQLAAAEEEHHDDTTNADQ